MESVLNIKRRNPMRQIHYATQNKGKVQSFRRVLTQYGIKVIHFDIDLSLSEPRIDDLQVITREKVLTAFQRIKQPVVALDSGCYIPALNGFPGVFVNFVLETIKLEGILKLLEGKPRKCEFRDCLAYFDGRIAQPLFFESSVIGVLSETQRGETNEYSWSVLSTLFVPEGEHKTLTEMSPEEYLEWSKKHHQNSYASKFVKWFLNQ
jgi:XTP/dITP diphosphohydrolase